MNTDELKINVIYISFNNSDLTLKSLVTKRETSTPGYKYVIISKDILNPGAKSSFIRSVKKHDNTFEEVNCHPNFKLGEDNSKFYIDQEKDYGTFIEYETPWDCSESETKQGLYYNKEPTLMKKVSDMEENEVGYWCAGGSWMCVCPDLGSIKIRLLKKYEDGSFEASFNGDIKHIPVNYMGDYNFSTARTMWVSKSVDEAKNLNKKKVFYNGN